ncbi:hypothetical protein PIB30_087696, partial [Stylosanthes scabra]|nr:hypothetical protein [Stylosanthes scabra]
MEVETIDVILAQNKVMAQQLSAMNKKIEKLEVLAVETQTACGLCGGPHENHNYSFAQDYQSSAEQ